MMCDRLGSSWLNTLLASILACGACTLTSVTERISRRTRRVVVVDESALAQRIGERLRSARINRGLSQRDVAGARFTPQYVSALERGAVKPSMAALNYLAERLRVPARDLLDQPAEPWTRVEADVKLASGDAQGAADQYGDLLRTAPSSTARAEALSGLAEALCRLNRGADAVSPAAEAVELFEAAGRTIDAVWAAYWLASAQYQSDNVSESRSILEGLLQRVRAGLAVEPGFKLRLLTSLASVVGWSGEHGEALSYLEEGRELIGALDTRARAAYFYSMAQNYKQTGDLEAAVRSGLRSLALYEELDSQLEVSVLHNHLALTYLRLGNLERAAQYAHQAAGEVERLGDRRSRAWVLETQAQIAMAEGRADAALALAEEAIMLEPEGASPDTVLTAWLTTARVHLTAGRSEAALTSFEEASERVRAGTSAARRREVLAEFAEFLNGIGEEKRALQLYREAVQP